MFTPKHLTADQITTIFQRHIENSEMHHLVCEIQQFISQSFPGETWELEPGSKLLAALELERDAMLTRIKGGTADGSPNTEP